MPLGYDAKDAVLADACFKTRADARFLGLGKSRAVANVQKERNAGADLVDVLSAGPAAARELKRQQVFRDINAFLDFDHCVVSPTGSGVGFTVVMIRRASAFTSSRIM